MSGQVSGIMVTAFVAGFGLGMVVMARMMRARFAAAIHRICDLAEARANGR